MWTTRGRRPNAVQPAKTKYAKKNICQIFIEYISHISYSMLMQSTNIRSKWLMQQIGRVSLITKTFQEDFFLFRWTLFLWPHPPIQIGRLSPTGKEKYKYKYAKIQIHKYLPSKSENSRLQERIMIFFSQETLIFLCVYLDNQQGGVLHQNKASDQ